MYQSESYLSPLISSSSLSSSFSPVLVLYITPSCGRSWLLRLELHPPWIPLETVVCLLFTGISVSHYQSLVKLRAKQLFLVACAGDCWEISILDTGSAFIALRKVTSNGNRTTLSKIDNLVWFIIITESSTFTWPWPKCVLFKQNRVQSLKKYSDSISMLARKILMMTRCQIFNKADKWNRCWHTWPTIKVVASEQ